MCEILAPSGDKNSAFAAINAGADAIYLGLKNFSARSSAENFDDESLKKIVDYAHILGVKVYVAMNTLVKSSELEEFCKTAVKVWNFGADALIISDIFLGKFLKQNVPEIILHLSTQAGVCNEKAALLAKEYGFDRVILSRETKYEDIKCIARIIETEVFVQGALCTCFSGQCYLSSFAGGKSGNRGKCKQPCRKQYSIDRSGFEERAYRLSLSDLSVGEDIFKLKEAGVKSFKIEGRMRRPEYVSAAVKYYKNILSGSQNNGDLSDLKRTYNRGNYTKGLAFGQDKNFISSAVQGHIGEFVGVIKVENGKYVCLSKQKFAKGDGFKILRDSKEIGGASFAGETKDGIILASGERLKNGDKVFITTDTALNLRLAEQKRLLPVKVSAKFLVGSNAEIEINGFKFVGENVLEAAKTSPLTKNELCDCLKKTDGLPFEISFGNIETDNVFIAKSRLNKLRRAAYSAFILSAKVERNVSLNLRFPNVNTAKNDKIAAICTDLSEISANIGILKLDSFDADIDELTQNFKGEKYLYLPPYLTGSEIEKVKTVAEKFDGIYCEGIYGLKLCEELNKPLFAGAGLNLSNDVDIALCNAKYVTISKELTVSEAKELAASNAFYLSAGNIKVMDLIYCPFEKKCKTCDMRKTYTLTDTDGRKFTLRRYKTGECRFELYNCANLATDGAVAGIFVDCTLEDYPENLIKVCKNTENIKNFYGGNYTRGHSVQQVK